MPSGISIKKGTWVKINSEKTTNLHYDNARGNCFLSIMMKGNWFKDKQTKIYVQSLH